jgi:hypothetical protein
MDIVFFWIYLVIGVIILVIFYKLYSMIKNVNYRRLFKITNIIIMFLLAFFASIDGLKGNSYLDLFIIEFLLSIIKYKNMIYYPNKHTIKYIHNE